LAGNVARKGKQRLRYRLLVWKPLGKRPFLRSGRRWKDNIRVDLRELDCKDVMRMVLTKRIVVNDRLWC